MVMLLLIMEKYFEHGLVAQLQKLYSSSLFSCVRINVFVDVGIAVSVPKHN